MLHRMPTSHFILSFGDYAPRNNTPHLKSVVAVSLGVLLFNNGMKAVYSKLVPILV